MTPVRHSLAPGEFALLRLSILVFSLSLGCATLPDSETHSGDQENPEALQSVPSDATASDEAAHETEEGEEEPKNFTGLFLGATRKGSEYGFSIGAKYERRITKLMGLGLIVESTPQTAERIITVPSLFLHPYGGLSLAVAPGFEFTEDATTYMLRLGVGWDFQLGKGFTLAPELNYDIVNDDDNAVVLGITLGCEF